MGFFKKLFQSSKDKDIQAIAKYMNDQEDMVKKIGNCMHDLSPCEFGSHMHGHLARTYGVSINSTAAIVIGEVERLNNRIKEQEKLLSDLQERHTEIASRYQQENRELIDERNKLKEENNILHGRTTEKDVTTIRRNENPSKPVKLEFGKPIHKNTKKKRIR